ncbi:hypothetical protein WJX73_005200 [Symbiochloris irregularis]|uniref:Thioredoxin n=1 Tax=Symbiochloris irregularis TaxID=706552 RepID=A0AAW1Q1T0_9CHLO
MLLGSQTPILVDFYATWCGPCQLMSNVIQEVAANFPKEERLQVVKIDIDKYPALATRLRVQALPTLMLFRGGKQLDRVEGLLDAKMLSQRLRYYLRGLDAKFGRSQR